MMKAKDIARTRGVAILAVVVCLCMVIPALAMNVQAGPDGTATFDRGHTYKWYDATGGADSGSGTVAGGEYDIGTRRVGAYANVIDFSLGDDRMGEGLEGCDLSGVR